jgi:hypothetical protein
LVVISSWHMVVVALRSSGRYLFLRAAYGKYDVGHDADFI